MNQLIRLRRKYPLVIMIVVFLLFGLCSFKVIDLSGLLYVNVSASERLGLYLVVPMDQLHRGDKVIMQVPPSIQDFMMQRQYIEDQATLLKTVYALPGDQFSVSDQMITVNGSYIGPVFEDDSQKRPLPVLRGDYIVHDHEFLPLATNRPNSFDGRYFGEVEQGLIIHKVVPLILFPEGIL